MKKNIDYWEEGGEDEESPISLSALELSEFIEQRLENRPSTITKLWKREVNELIDEYNNKFGRVYKRV